MTSLAVLRAGERAVQFLSEDVCWSVQVVSARSFWLVAGTRWVACVDATLGGGPLQVQLAGDVAKLTERLRVGDRARVIPGKSLCIADESLCLGNISIGARQPVNALGQGNVGQGKVDQGNADVMLVALDGLVDNMTPPADGLARLIDENQSSMNAALWRHALPAVTAMRDWACTGFAEPAPCALLRLVGLGPGLTPSGDDFLGGAALALRWAGHRSAVMSLATVLAEHGQDCTTPLSSCCLGAALDGYALDAVQELFTALETGRSRDVGAALASLVAIGHTSGWDMLAGIRFGLMLGSLSASQDGFSEDQFLPQS